MLVKPASPSLDFLEATLLRCLLVSELPVFETLLAERVPELEVVNEIDVKMIPDDVELDDLDAGRVVAAVTIGGNVLLCLGLWLTLRKVDECLGRCASAMRQTELDDGRTDWNGWRMGRWVWLRSWLMVRGWPMLVDWLGDGRTDWIGWLLGGAWTG